MKTIDDNLLNRIGEAARLSPRRRMNYNFHENNDTPINRLLNAIEPDSYIRPHRHRNPDKEEIFLILRGKAVLFLFDDSGRVTDRFVISPKEGTYGAEVEPGVWHSLLVLEPDTVIYEIKQGPFMPLATENMAPWSPVPENTEGVSKYMDYLRSEYERT